MSDNLTKEPFLYVFLKDSMKVGGIETYIYQFSEHIAENGGQVLLALNRSGVLDESYYKLNHSVRIHIVHKRYCLKDIKNIVKSNGIQKVNIISFELIRFAFSCYLKERLSKYCNVSTLYFVPHFTGSASYPEELYKGKKRERVRARFETIVHKMNENDCIRYFSVVHKKEMTKRYNYTVHNESKQFLPKRGGRVIPFDKKRCVDLSQRTQFNILSVSRLEFPHKGFVIGLIQAYGILKKHYPNITLTIIGYGEGSSKIQEEIGKLDDSSQKDINVVGKVAPDDLLKYYNDANVCVSLAKCFRIGAKNGTLSLPVRHYTYACETYGFLPESKEFALSVEPGQPVIDYLEKIINMDTETYVSMCKKCYDTYNNVQPQGERESIFTLSDGGNKKTLSIADTIFLLSERFCYHLYKILKI